MVRHRAQLLEHLAGQCLGLLHLGLRTVGGDSKTCNANRAISTSPQQPEHSSFHSLHLPESSLKAKTITMTILIEQGLIHCWVPVEKKLPQVRFVYSMLQFAVKQQSTNTQSTTPKKPNDPPRMSQSARESPAANKRLLSTPVPHRAASSHEAEMASHEQPKAGETNFSLCQPCSVIKRHLVAVVHAAFPRPKAPPAGTRALNPSITCPPSACSPVFGCCYLVF